MKSAFEAFPEVLLVDATYKLLDLRMPVYLLLIIDGNGQSEIVGIFLAAKRWTLANLRCVYKSKKQLSSVETFQVQSHIYINKCTICISFLHIII